MSYAKTDKLDTCTKLLEDCIVGYFAGNSMQTTIHLSYAVMTIIRDLSRHYRKTLNIDLEFETIAEQSSNNPKLAKSFKRNITSPDGYSESLIDRANYVKHADKDSFSEALYEGVEDRHQLHIAIQDHANFVSALLKQNRVTVAAAILGLPPANNPRYIAITKLFYAFYDECETLAAPFHEKKDSEAALIVIDEVKEKYSRLIQDNQIWFRPSKHDQLVLLDPQIDKVKNSFKKKQPKPSGPV